MTQQQPNQENTVGNEHGKQTPIDPELRKVVDDTQSGARSTAKPEASPGSGSVLFKDEPTQEEEQP